MASSRPWKSLFVALLVCKMLFSVSFLQGRAFGYRRTGHAIYSFTSDAGTGNQIGSKSTITLNGERDGAERNQRGEFRLLVAPKTAFHIGPNRARFRGVATVDQLKHSRCVIVGENKMVDPFRVGAGLQSIGFGCKRRCQEEIVEEEGEDVLVTVLPEGTSIPDDLWLYERPTGCYNLKTAHPCTLKEFYKKLNSFMNSLRMVNRTEYMSFPNMH